MPGNTSLNLRLISRAFAEPLVLAGDAAHQLERLAVMAHVGAVSDDEIRHQAGVRAERWGRRLKCDADRAAGGAKGGGGKLMSFDDGEGDVAEKKPPAPPYTFVGAKKNIALVTVTGVLDRTEEDVTDSRGNSFGTAYETLAANMAGAVVDSRVAGIMLLVNSPGGAALPCAECAAAIAAAAAQKPVCSYTLDMNCSGALWLSSQGTRGGLMVGPSSMIGSIGATTFHYDESAALAKWGVKVTQFSSAEGKTLGASHRPLEQADRASLQKRVDQIGTQFEQAVMSGRGATQDQVDAWKKESALIGTDAAGQGLADGVQINLVSAIAAMELKFAAQMGPSKNDNRGTAAAARAGSGVSTHAARSSNMTIQELMAMAGGPALVDSIRAEGHAAGKKLGLDEGRAEGIKSALPKPATIGELRAEFADDAEFVLSCAEKGLSMDQAKANRAAVVAERFKALKAENDKLTAELADRRGGIAKLAAANVRPGTAPVAHSEPEPAGGEMTFEAAVDAEFADMKARHAKGEKVKLLRSVAVATVTRRSPELYAKHKATLVAGVAPRGAFGVANNC